jgi:hypothetical protein
MSFSISFKQAAEVAVVAVTLGSCPSTGILAAAGTVACGTLGLLCISLISRINTSRLKARHQQLYRVAPPLDFSQTQKATCQRTLAKVENFKSYQWYKKRLSLKTQKEVVEGVDRELSKGCCYGEACALLDVKEESESFSLKNRMDSITPEEVIYRQIIHELKCETAGKRARIDERIQTKGLLAADVSIQVEYRETKLEQYRQEEVCLSAEDSFSFPCKNRKIPPDASPALYQRCLEKASSSSSIKDGHVRGIVDLPQHAMAFQYGPQEYFIYDPFDANRGLFQYPDKEAFFAGMRLLVQLYYMEAEGIENEEACISFAIYQGHPTAL